MTYLELEKFLNDNHFYPDLITKVGKSGTSIVGLRVQCPPILQESRKARLEEILTGKKVKVDQNTKEGYLEVRIIK